MLKPAALQEMTFTIADETRSSRVQLATGHSVVSDTTAIIVIGAGHFSLWTSVLGVFA